MFSIGSGIAVRTETPEAMSPSTAAEIAMEYASLSAPRACPRGMYITPSPDSLLKWYGVFFVHSGPYTGAILRFVLNFASDYPNSAPIIKFDSEVFHPLIDTKTKVWHPRRHISKWQPRIHHIPHLLHDLKQSFKSSVLDNILENEAINKHIWSLYHNSHHTFLSMTTRRAVSTTSALALYPSDIGENSVHTNPVIIPGSPTAPKAPPKHIRQTSYTGSLRSKASLESLRGEGEGYIAFKKLEDVERKGLMEVLKRKGPGR